MDLTISLKIGGVTFDNSEDSEGSIELSSASGISSLSTGSAVAGNQAVTVTLKDPSGRFKAMHSPSLIFQEGEVKVAGETLFTGYLVPPLSWDEDSREATLTLDNLVESELVGFTLGDDDVSPSSYADLIGQAWPLTYGQVSLSPTIPYDTSRLNDGEPYDSSEGGFALKWDRSNEYAIVASSSLLSAKESDVFLYVKALKALHLYTNGAFNMTNIQRAGGEPYQRAEATFPIAFRGKDYSDTFLKDKSVATLFHLGNQAGLAQGKLSVAGVTESSLNNLERQIENWAGHYHTYMSFTTSDKLEAKVQSGGEWSDKAIAYADENSSYTSSLNAVLSQCGSNGQGFSPGDDIPLVENSIRNIGPLFNVNINGCKISTRLRRDKLENCSLQPCITGMSINNITRSTFKSSSLYNVTGMYCKIGSYIVYAHSGSAKLDSDGNFLEAIYAYGPSVWTLSATGSENVTYKATMTEISGSISQASPVWLPSWGENNLGEGESIPYINADLSFNLKEMTRDPRTATPVRTPVGMPENNVAIQPGDEVRPWVQPPSWEPYSPWEPSDLHDADRDDNSIRYLVSFMNVVVLNVYTEVDDRIVAISSENWQQISAPYHGTAISFTAPLTTLVDGAGAVFVDLSSPVQGVDLSWVAQQAGLQIGTISLGNPLPSDYTLVETPNGLDYLKRLAFQTYSLLVVDQGVVSMFPADVGRPSTVTYSDADILEGSEVTDFYPPFTEYVDLFKGVWQSDYFSEPRKVVSTFPARRRASKEREETFFAYTDGTAVMYSLNKWAEHYGTFRESRTVTLMPEATRPKLFEKVQLPGFSGIAVEISFNPSDFTTTISVEER